MHTDVLSVCICVHLWLIQQEHFMATELPKAYEPKEAQQRWLQFWDERGYFHSRPDLARKPFCIVIPPPNVTGALHMGHALNNTLQDVLIRWRRMQGFNALYMPGTDHAGIATQAVVERRIREEEGKSRHDLGRDELVKRIWQWKDQYESRILDQLKQLGCSCDWPRTRFTLDPICTRAVRHTFFKMFRDGYIYRGKRLVNWDTQLQTSVADDETYTEEVKGGFWTFRYPVSGTGEFIRFSTTRPETMLGDTAVAVHPDDPRYRHLIGKTVRIPLVDREIPIIADGLLVDPSLGTGCVKVTPAHDPNDYACGLRHKLPMVNILNPDGTINENGGKYAGMDRYKAREAVIKDMENLGLFEGREDRDIPLKFSDRSKTPIEPYLSDQWFVRMGDRDDGKMGFARMAMEAVESGKVKFFPERYANSYLDWLAEKRDWCISRQLWWGHRIPVWRLRVSAAATDDEWNAAFHWSDVDEMFGNADEEYAVSVVDVATQQALSIAGNDIREIDAFRGRELEVLLCKKRDDWNLEFEGHLDQLGYVQDPDVLDTWFSSQLWPHSTLGWPGPALPDQPPGPANPEWSQMRYYYPTSVLVTNRDIITLWVVRMVVAGLFNTGEIPFHHVYIHPKILDAFGEGMSKSKGNGVDPLDIIERYGTDALRYGMVHLSTETQDSRLPVSNVCPHCGVLVQVKQEHMYMRTRKIACPSCKKPFRPGGPWPSEDAELPTAKQASERFEIGRNFANKLWNAARFLLMNLDGYSPSALRLEDMPIEDRWILSRLATTTQAMTDQLESYHFSDAARTIYEFTWSEFCDWYIEMSKGRLREAASRLQAQRVLAGVLDAILRLVQPIMPFVAESIWQALNEAAFERGLPGPEPASESVVIAPWPEFPASWQDAAMEQRLARMQELVKAVREVRNSYDLKKDARLEIFVRCSDSVAADFQALTPFISQLAGVSRLECGPSIRKPQQPATHVHPDFEAYVSLLGLIDPAAEIKRLEKQLAQLKKHLQATQAKLGNPSFVDRAPPEVVQQQRDQVAELEKQIQVIEANLLELRQD
jgi:valyl-tRNA synthetase